MFPSKSVGSIWGWASPGEWARTTPSTKKLICAGFAAIQELGANTVRVYTILQDDFYNAFYEYNTQREEAGEEPLWLIHGRMG